MAETRCAPQRTRAGREEPTTSGLVASYSGTAQPGPHGYVGQAHL